MPVIVITLLPGAAVLRFPRQHLVLFVVRTLMGTLIATTFVLLLPFA